jgi:hypothetical protein
MERSEAAYEGTRASWKLHAVASSKGALARSCGISSNENPYVRPEALPPTTGETREVWFRQCDAWWRGWDGEDERRRTERLGRRLTT